MSLHQTEEAIKKVGSFGWFQLRLFGVVGYSSVIATMVVLVMTFSTAEPAWKCLENSTVCTLNGTYKIGDKHYKDRCKIPRSEWKFDVEESFDSIVTEWDLVCDKAVYVSIVNSLTFILWLAGNVIASILSDKYGRKMLVFPCAAIMFFAGFASAFAQKYWVFALLRSLVGIGMGMNNQSASQPVSQSASQPVSQSASQPVSQSASQPVSQSASQPVSQSIICICVGGLSATRYILLMEYIGIKHRSTVGMAFMFNWVLGCMLLALLGYLIPSWRTLSIVTSAPGVIFLFFWWCQPESLRWLLMKGKISEAKKILVQVGKMNGKHLDDEDIVLIKEDDHNENKPRLGDIRDLFANRTIARHTMISCFAWFSIVMVYYGILLGTPNIGGNMYLNFFISATCEAVANCVGIYTLQKFGRKKSIAVSIWITGIAIVVSGLLMYYDDGSVEYFAGKMLMTMAIGRFFIVLAFNAVFVHTSELFPTVIRNTALGCCSGMARIGSGISPYLLYTERFHPFIKFGVFAFSALLSGALFFALPETRNCDMTDTVVNGVQQCDYERANDDDDMHTKM